MEGKHDHATTATPPATGKHPDNQQASRGYGDQELPPYIILGEPVAAGGILHFFNTLLRKLQEPIIRKVEELQLKYGGNALLYKRTFSCSPAEEHLKEAFTCYLSTATGGPVAGTLYLTNTSVTFCSDRPLSFAALPGKAAAAACSYCYYKVLIPLGKIATVEPVTMMDNPFPQVKYVHVITVDSHDFWFMGFDSSGKAVHSLVQAVSQRS